MTYIRLTRTLAVAAYLALYLALLLILAGCAHKPTKVFTTEDIDTIFLEKKLQRPIHIDAKTVFVDARSNFKYAMLHAPTAVHLSWTDFTKFSKSGVLKKDLNAVAKRLALFGIAPTSHIVVLSGSDRTSRIHASYIAWVLFYMGISDVQTVDMHRLGIHYYNINPPPRPNAPVWQPHFMKNMLATRHELNKLRAKRHNPHVHLLNVAHAWRRYFNKDGRPNLEMKRKLNAQSVKDTDRIIVVSKRGIRAAAVAYALIAMGFRNVAAFLGG